MIKINKLTPEQEAYLPEFREQWLKVGLDTSEIDEPKAKNAVVNLYKVAGLDEPMVLFFSSPAVCLLARGVLKTFLSISAENQLEGQLWAQLRGQLWDQLWAQLRAQLEGQLGGQLWDQLEGQLRGQLYKDVYQYPWTIGGQDAFWLSFYEFGRVIGANYSNNGHLNAYIDYAKNCGWMFAYKEVAFVSHRPSEIHFDERGLLHCESEKAVKYSDGWGISSWHGTRIPCEWLDGKTLTPEIALHHENVEQRRAACEILGWNNVLNKLNAKTIDKNPNPFVGELLEVDIPDIGREKFLRVKCPTGRQFAMPVPPEMKSASEAQRWLRPVPDFCTDNLVEFMPKEAR
jgi:hypothetical protein